MWSRWSSSGSTCSVTPRRRSSIRMAREISVGGSLPIRRDRLRAPCPELAWLVLVAGGADDEGGVAVVTAVQHAAQFFVVGKEAVGFVDHEGRLPALDRPEDGSAR